MEGGAKLSPTSNVAFRTPIAALANGFACAFSERSHYDPSCATNLRDSKTIHGHRIDTSFGRVGHD
jgi:hypothetical protein